MPEGDTIMRAAGRIRPVLVGRVPDEIRTPQRRHERDRWPERLAGRAVEDVITHGKHLFVRFEGDLVLHSHLRMSGSWAVFGPGSPWRRSPRRAWIVMRAGEDEVVEFDGPVLELMTEGRRRFDQRLAALGPDLLADDFDERAFLRRLRADDPTRGFGDALLDQRIVAGVGNAWKCEGLWEAGIDPWRRVADISDDEALATIALLRPAMLRSGRGERVARRCAYNHAGEPCPRCGTTIRARGQGDDNRTTFWCPGCQR